MTLILLGLKHHCIFFGCLVLYPSCNEVHLMFQMFVLLTENCWRDHWPSADYYELLSCCHVFQKIRSPTKSLKLTADNNGNFISVSAPFYFHWDVNAFPYIQWGNLGLYCPILNLSLSPQRVTALLVASVVPEFFSPPMISMRFFPPSYITAVSWPLCKKKAL